MSITIAALHNLWPVATVNEAAIAFVFGLFHGFGFASVLGSLGLGTDHLVLSLLGFNLGVEIGQVAIIAAVFPVLFLTRRLRIVPTGRSAWARSRSWPSGCSGSRNGPWASTCPLTSIAKAMLGMESDSASTT